MPSKFARYMAKREEAQKRAESRPDAGKDPFLKQSPDLNVESRPRAGGVSDLRSLLQGDDSASGNDAMAGLRNVRASKMAGSTTRAQAREHFSSNVLNLTHLIGGDRFGKQGVIEEADYDSDGASQQGFASDSEDEYDDEFAHITARNDGITTSLPQGPISSSRGNLQGQHFEDLSALADAALPSSDVVGEGGRSKEEARAAALAGHRRGLLHLPFRRGFESTTRNRPLPENDEQRSARKELGLARAKFNESADAAQRLHGPRRLGHKPSLQVDPNGMRLAGVGEAGAFTLLGGDTTHASGAATPDQAQVSAKFQRLKQAYSRVDPKHNMNRRNAIRATSIDSPAAQTNEVKPLEQPFLKPQYRPMMGGMPGGMNKAPAVGGEIIEASEEMENTPDEGLDGVPLNAGYFNAPADEEAPAGIADSGEVEKEPEPSWAFSSLSTGPKTEAYRKKKAKIAAKIAANRAKAAKAAERGEAPRSTSPKRGIFSRIGGAISKAARVLGNGLSSLGSGIKSMFGPRQAPLGPPTVAFNPEGLSEEELQKVRAEQASNARMAYGQEDYERQQAEREQMRPDEREHLDAVNHPVNFLDRANMVAVGINPHARMELNEAEELRRMMSLGDDPVDQNPVDQDPVADHEGSGGWYPDATEARVKGEHVPEPQSVIDARLRAKRKAGVPSPESYSAEEADNESFTLFEKRRDRYFQEAERYVEGGEVPYSGGLSPEERGMVGREFFKKFRENPRLSFKPYARNRQEDVFDAQHAGTHNPLYPAPPAPLPGVNEQEAGLTLDPETQMPNSGEVIEDYFLDEDARTAKHAQKEEQHAKYLEIMRPYKEAERRKAEEQEKRRQEMLRQQEDAKFEIDKAVAAESMAGGADSAVAALPQLDEFQNVVDYFGGAQDSLQPEAQAPLNQSEAQAAPQAGPTQPQPAGGKKGFWSKLFGSKPKEAAAGPKVINIKASASQARLRPEAKQKTGAPPQINQDMSGYAKQSDNLKSRLVDQQAQLQQALSQLQEAKAAKQPYAIKAAQEQVEIYRQQASETESQIKKFGETTVNATKKRAMYAKKYGGV
jgi:hypothetical protein